MKGVAKFVVAPKKNSFNQIISYLFFIILILSLTIETILRDHNIRNFIGSIKSYLYQRHIHNNNFLQRRLSKYEEELPNYNPFIHVDCEIYFAVASLLPKEQ